MYREYVHSALLRTPAWTSQLIWASACAMMQGGALQPSTRSLHSLQIFRIRLRNYSGKRCTRECQVARETPARSSHPAQALRRHCLELEDSGVLLTFLGSPEPKLQGRGFHRDHFRVVVAAERAAMPQGIPGLRVLSMKSWPGAGFFPEAGFFPTVSNNFFGHPLHTRHCSWRRTHQLKPFKFLPHHSRLML